MKLFKSAPKESRVKNPQISPTSTLDVSSFQDSAISVAAEVIRHPLASGPFSNRESRLRIKITNEGEKEIENLSVEAVAPEGTLLVDPGILFGTTRRHVRLPRLLPTKSITYKLGIRAQEGFSSGILLVEIKESYMKSANSEFRVRIGLTSQ
jgi:dihydropteroate synthase